MNFINRMSVKRSKITSIALTAAMALTVSACTNMDDEEASSPTTEARMTETTLPTLTPTGAACSQVPTSGEGSVAGMADDPVATAASNNPLLTTLVKAVTAAGLGDTLNGAGPYTVFAPIDPAFAKVPAADLNALLADKAKLSSVLTYHVVPGRLTATDLAAGQPLKTVNGDTITVSGAGTSMKVDNANIICANVPVRNGVVHLVDTVLMPG